MPFFEPLMLLLVKSVWVKTTRDEWKMRKKMSRKAYISGVLQGGSRFQVHPLQQIGEARVVAEGVELRTYYL